MGRDRRTIGFTLRATIAAVIVFTVTLAVIGVTVVRLVEVRLYDDLAARISEEVVLFSEIYQDTGVDGLREAIDTLTAYDTAEPRLVAGFSVGGRLVSGNLKLQPDFIGWGSIQLADDPEKVAYRTRVKSLGDVVLVVGRSTAEIVSTRDILVRILLVAGLSVVAISLVIGLLLSRRIQRKLAALTDALERVADGNLAVRLPVGRDADEIDRTARLMNAQLERLQVATDALRNTIVSVAHDLRTPLNRIALLIHAAERDDAADDKHVPEEAGPHTNLVEAQEEIARLSGTFDAILRIARIEAGGDDAAVTRVSAAAIVHEIAETYAPVLEANEQHLVVARADEDTVLECDEKMVFQMLANLVENASLHTPAGTTVWLSVFRGDGPVVEVADDGPGIPPERREGVMRPFEQWAARGDVRGTGLGLALVRAIAERHGAQLELLDNGPGLKVRMTFPAR